MWYPPPWSFPPMMYGQQQQPDQDPIRMARRWEKFLKQERNQEKKEEKKEHPPLTPMQLAFFLMVFGPLVGTVYVYIIVEMALHIADMLHK